VRTEALRRAPLRGTVRVLVVLVEFPDKRMKRTTAARMQELFFSTGALEHGSVREYFTDVSRRKIRIDGEVVGPYTMPRPLSEYAGSENGTQGAQPNARTLANDALTASVDDVDLGPYDNDGNGYVDAFIVVHAGRGAEQTGSPGDIWSHKWVLPQARAVDGTKVYGYLTIPEDARLGVCAHELGHLLFGWPDLYDTDYSSEGVGEWCLMAAGSWGLGGLRPVHPSAWCKVSQDWAPVSAPTRNAAATIRDVKDTGRIYRLWTDGTESAEHFLVENRGRSGYDESLPSGGLLIWHIDDDVESNSDERHYKVALLQADGRRDLERDANAGDAGDPWPGSAEARTFDDASSPASTSYSGQHTCVAVTEIPTASDAMRVRLQVRCPAGTP
jgi:immune inhibitor A